MIKKMKILRPTHYGVAGIFFPIGDPEIGGSCQFASDKCLRECWALDKEYDEIINMSEEEKVKIYNFFIKEPTIDVCNEIIKEIDELQAKILSWFVSGDCLDKDIDKVFNIIYLLNDKNVVQNGFTRNKILYERLIQVKIENIILTVESKESASEYLPEGIYSIPNYDKKISELYYGKLGYTSYGSCGGGTYKHEFEGKKIEIASNCLGCYKRKIGCFIDIKKCHLNEEYK